MNMIYGYIYHVIKGILCSRFVVIEFPHWTALVLVPFYDGELPFICHD